MERQGCPDSKAGCGGHMVGSFAACLIDRRLTGEKPIPVRAVEALEALRYAFEPRCARP